MDSSGDLKLDFRFACDDDAEELVEFIGKCRETDSSFRDLENGHSVDSVRTDCSGSEFRWVVLEACSADEEIMAAARFCMHGTVSLTVDTLCAAGEGAAQQQLLNRLVVKLEAVASSHGVEALCIQLTQWQEEWLDWIVTCGYEDRGGFLSDAPEYSLPTMVLQHWKNLRSKSTAMARTSDPKTADSGSLTSTIPLLPPPPASSTTAVCLDLALDIDLDLEMMSGLDLASQLVSSLVSSGAKEGAQADFDLTSGYELMKSEVLSADDASVVDSLTRAFGSDRPRGGPVEDIDACSLSADDKTGSNAPAVSKRSGDDDDDADLESLVRSLFRALHSEAQQRDST